MPRRSAERRGRPQADVRGNAKHSWRSPHLAADSDALIRSAGADSTVCAVRRSASPYFFGGERFRALPWQSSGAKNASRERCPLSAPARSAGEGDRAKRGGRGPASTLGFRCRSFVAAKRRRSHRFTIAARVSSRPAPPPPRFARSPSPAPLRYAGADEECAAGCKTARHGLSLRPHPSEPFMANAPSSLIDRAGLDRARLNKIVSRGLDGADDGELYLEYRQSEALVFDNGRLKQATYDTSQGFGLRAVKDEAVGYAHASDVSEAAIARAADSVRAVKGGYSGTAAQAPGRTNVRLYTDENPLGAPSFETKVKLLQEIDAYARAKDPRVRQVTASIAASWQVVEILRADGESYRDVRPLVRVNVSVVAGDGDRQESGSHGYGGREGYERFIASGAWKGAVDDAVRQATVNLAAVPAPAGEMDVVLGAGWPGVMLHEAVGHGLEGDFNRKKTSAFAGLMGQQVAAKGVTVVDDGTMASRRGSLSIDDEGTPTNRT